VEAPVGGQLGGDVARLGGVDARAGRVAHALQRLLVEDRQRVARGALLEQGAQRVDLLEVLDAQPRDEVAAPRQVGQLALLLEDPQRLAHRRDRQPQLRREVLLVDATARPQHAADDQAPERVDRVLLGGGDAHRKAWMPVSAPPTTSAWTSAVPS
jgi:hypothetical protein